MKGVKTVFYTCHWLRAKVEASAQANSQTMSEWIRRACLQRLRSESVGVTPVTKENLKHETIR